MFDWIKQNYTIGTLDVIGECIVWGNGFQYYGIFTPVDKFVEMFGETIRNALENGEDVKEAIRNSDPGNLRGFNDII
ncbi:hypothetical protein M3231_11835 [Neobacillus mesonae]|nr:hypothetical protein [Neobacillus mesonae]